MRLVIQRVNHASVTVDRERIGAIDRGLLVFLGIADGDTEDMVNKYVKKLSGLRIFEDENGKTNLSLTDVGGEILVVSQFTLYADCKKGNRPSFSLAGERHHAEKMYLYFNEYMRSLGVKVDEGIFGADMKVRLLNDGPVTIILDSSEW